MPLIGRRRPVLRAAAVGAGAYYAGKKRQEGMEREYGQEARLQGLESQQAVPPAAPAAGGMPPDAIEQLKQLGDLHEQGVLTDEEFAAQKAKLLGG
jgi:Short C-terminal domain